MKLIILLALLFTSSVPAFSGNQEFTLTGYVDTYYTSDNTSSDVADFTSINHQRDKFALNIAYLLFNFKTDDYRIKIGLQEGDIPQSIYFEEPKNIQQANIGVKLTENLWLDGGIMSTHIGGEITHPRMNFLSTHSNITYFEPTYQTGVKLSYEFTKEISAELQLINGNHLFGDNNDQKTLAYGVTYQAETWSAFYAGMLGNEEPRNLKGKLHTYHNLYVSKEIGKQIEVKAQVDLASIETSRNNQSVGLFYGAFVQSRFKFNYKYSISGRFSYFSDTENVYKLNVEGYDLTGGLEFKPFEKSYIRFETRYMQFNAGSEKNQFIRKSKAYNNLLEFSLNFGVWFDIKV